MVVKLGKSQHFCYNSASSRFYRENLYGQVAQSVEQRIENPRVGSSILPLATIQILKVLLRNVMKKNTKVTIAVALIGLVATAAVAFKYVNARVKIKELEAVSRLQNLTLIAIGNKDYVLACKSQTEAEQYLGKVHSKAEDLLGMIHKSNQDLCNKAAKTQSK